MDPPPQVGTYSLNEFVPLLGDSAVQGERHLSPFGTVLRRWSVSDVVAGKYDLGPNPPPAPPLGNKTDPDPSVKKTRIRPYFKDHIRIRL